MSFYLDQALKAYDFLPKRSPRLIFMDIWTRCTFLSISSKCLMTGKAKAIVIQQATLHPVSLQLTYSL